MYVFEHFIFVLFSGPIFSSIINSRAMEMCGIENCTLEDFERSQKPTSGTVSRGQVAVHDLREELQRHTTVFAEHYDFLSSCLRIL
jgi:hypothetical protein